MLDVGCGYGSLVNYLREGGYDAQGIDADPEAIAVARRLFPQITVQVGKAEEMAAEGGEPFDCITLKDCLHHLVGESDAEKAFEVFKRLLRPGGRVVILDPNPNWVVRGARALAAHRDFQAPLPEALELLGRHGFQVGAVRYYEVIGLPLSGGYVFVPLVPNVRALHAAVAGLNRLLSRVAEGVRLGPFVCWRYLISAELKAP